MATSKFLTGILNSSAFKNRMKGIQELAEKELTDCIQRYVYDAYPESPDYQRTYELLNSVTSTELEVTGNTLAFKVYLDPNKMHHTSLYGWEEKGIEAGDEVYIPFWINNGFTHRGYTGVEDRFHKRNPSHFIEQAIVEIQKDLNVRVKDALKIEVKKFTGKL